MADKKIIGISQYGLSWIGREGAALESHPYLFITKKGEDPFILIQQNLHEMNDFCVTLFEGIKNKASQQLTFSQEIDNYEGDEYFDILEIYHLGYDVENLGRMYCPASALVMIYANLIRSLHIIAKYYGQDHYKSWRTTRDNRGAELEQLVFLLEKIAGEKLDVFIERRVRILIDDNMRPLRNDFLHGNWEGVERRLLGISIKNCFEIVSHILYFLEQKFDENRLLSGKSVELA
ncbi:MAG: hypothetical protein IT509_02455 [Rhodocyclaceae bacterium]|nr:hypothetical protein [Rhodocyclaceae bacterium]